MHDDQQALLDRATDEEDAILRFRMIGSGIVSDRGSPNAVAASAKAMPCLRLLAAALRGSHVNRSAMQRLVVPLTRAHVFFTGAARDPDVAQVAAGASAALPASTRPRHGNTDEQLERDDDEVPGAVPQLADAAKHDQDDVQRDEGENAANQGAHRRVTGAS